MKYYCDKCKPSPLRVIFAGFVLLQLGCKCVLFYYCLLKVSIFQHNFLTAPKLNLLHDNFVLFLVSSEQSEYKK